MPRRLRERRIPRTRKQPEESHHLDLSRRHDLTFQCRALQNPRISDVRKRNQGHHLADDRNAVLGIGYDGGVAAWENNGVVRELRRGAATAWNGLPIGAGGEDGVSKVVAVADRADGGIKGDRADGADVEASNIIFAPNIRPLERRRHSATRRATSSGSSSWT